MAIADLDLETAWRRVKWDLGHRVFVRFAFESDLLDLGVEEWLEQLRSELGRGAYSPRPCEICEVPKGGFHLRPGARLDLKDHLVYSALLQAMYERIRDQLPSREAQKDFAYLLRASEDVPWFQQPAFRGWAGFQKASTDRIDAGAHAVLFADISGFYENIDLQRLRYILRTSEAPEGLLELLFQCLWSWAEPRGRGIPQGLSPSDLLGKVYLEPIDRRMEREGFDHIRYVDDFRVFCGTNLEAKKALRRLTTLLREWGLNLEGRKTEILDAHEARARIEGKIPRILELREELIRAVRAEGFEDPYLRAEALSDLELKQAEVARGVLEQAFREHFLDPEESSFDSSLYHFLANRLGRLRSDVALDFSLEQLAARPLETSYILDYLKNFVDREDVPERVLTYAASEEAIYEYQRFLIIRWLLEQRVNSEDGLRLARETMADRGDPLWLRSFAMAYVGEFGDAADLDSIEASYPLAAGELERALILCSLRRMARHRRNAVYGRFGGDGFLNSLAVRWAAS